MNQKEKGEMIKQIVIARIKAMSPNVRVALGSKGNFLSKDKLLSEVINNSETGKKILEIQWKYIQALKLGLI